MLGTPLQGQVGLTLAFPAATWAPALYSLCSCARGNISPGRLEMWWREPATRCKAQPAPKELRKCVYPFISHLCLVENKGRTLMGGITRAPQYLVHLFFLDIKKIMQLNAPVLDGAK